MLLTETDHKFLIELLAIVDVDPVKSHVPKEIKIINRLINNPKTIEEEKDFSVYLNKNIRNPLVEIYKRESANEIKDPLFQALIGLCAFKPFNDKEEPEEGKNAENHIPQYKCYITNDVIEEKNKAYYVSRHLADLTREIKRKVASSNN